MTSHQPPRTPKHNGPPGAGPSRNVFVRFQQGFERRFNQFREGYGTLLEQVIARRRAFVTISLAFAMGSLSLFFLLGRDYFPEVRSGVSSACDATAPRPGQDGTWITPGMVESYTELHRRGVAHSVEAWRGETLAGGLYGLSLGAAFFGESVFSRETDASKVAFVALVEQLGRWAIPLVDCQVYTEHLASLGVREWPRREFLAALHAALDRPTRLGPWRFDGA